MFITLEGIDGCGKSTQVNLLKKAFPNAVFVKEPSENRLGQLVREWITEYEIEPITQFYLLAAAREEQVEQIIWPALLAERTVIADRYFHSSLAYQIMASGQNTFELEDAIEISKRWPHPDITILIDACPIKTRERIKNPDRIESQGVEYFYAVRKAYNRLLEYYKYMEIVSQAPPDELHINIINKIKAIDGSS